MLVAGALLATVAIPPASAVPPSDAMAIQAAHRVSADVPYALRWFIGAAQNVPPGVILAGYRQRSIEEIERLESGESRGPSAAGVDSDFTALNSDVEQLAIQLLEQTRATVASESLTENWNTLVEEAYVLRLALKGPANQHGLSPENEVLARIVFRTLLSHQHSVDAAARFPIRAQDLAIVSRAIDALLTHRFPATPGPESPGSGSRGAALEREVSGLIATPTAEVAVKPAYTETSRRSLWDVVWATDARGRPTPAATDALIEILRLYSDSVTATQQVSERAMDRTARLDTLRASAAELNRQITTLAASSPVTNLIGREGGSGSDARFASDFATLSTAAERLSRAISSARAAANRTPPQPIDAAELTAVRGELAEITGSTSSAPLARESARLLKDVAESALRLAEIADGASTPDRVALERMRSESFSSLAETLDPLHRIIEAAERAGVKPSALNLPKRGARERWQALEKALTESDTRRAAQLEAQKIGAISSEFHAAEHLSGRDTRAEDIEVIVEHNRLTDAALSGFERWDLRVATQMLDQARQKIAEDRFNRDRGVEPPSLPSADDPAKLVLPAQSDYDSRLLSAAGGACPG